MYLLFPYTTLFRSQRAPQAFAVLVLADWWRAFVQRSAVRNALGLEAQVIDRKSTRLNSSHRCIYSFPTRRSSDLSARHRPSRFSCSRIGGAHLYSVAPSGMLSASRHK